MNTNQNLKENNMRALYHTIFQKISLLYLPKIKEQSNGVDFLYSYSSELYKQNNLYANNDFRDIFQCFFAEDKQKAFVLHKEDFIFLQTTEIIAYYFYTELKKKTFLNIDSFFDYLGLFMNDKHSIHNTISPIKKKEIKDLSHLIHFFLIIKTIEIQIDFFSINKEIYIKYLLLAMNINWLFQNFIELKISIPDQEIQKAETNSLMLIYSLFYLLQKYITKKLYILHVKLRYSFSYEITNLIKAQQKEIIPINMLDVLVTTYKIMYALYLEINALDNLSFIAMNNLLQKNPHLNSLNVVLIPYDEKTNLYSITRLTNFYQQTNLFKQAHKTKHQQVYDEIPNKDYNFFFNKMCLYFNKNLNKLIEYIFGDENISPILQLQQLTIGFELPDYFGTSFKTLDDILHTFLLKIIIRMRIMKHKLIKLEIKAPGLIFNYKKISLNNETCALLINNNNNDNCKLETLKLNVRMFYFDNLDLFLPLCIRHLVIGEINIETLNNLLKCIDRFKRLENLELSIWNGFKDYNSNINIIEQFMKWEKFPHKLNNVTVKFNMNFMYDDLENLFLNLNEVKHNVEKWKIVLYKNKIQMKETDDLNKLNEIIKNKINNKSYLSLHEMNYSRKKKLIDMFIRKGFVKKVNEFQSNEHRLNILLNILKFLYHKDSFEISLVVQEKEG